MNRFGRLHRLLLVTGVGCSTLWPLSLQAATPSGQAVLVPANALLHGMAKRDSEAMKRAALPGGTMVLMRDGKPVQMTLEALAERVGKPGTTSIEERIHDPRVRIDHDLAVV